MLSIPVQVQMIHGGLLCPPAAIGTALMQPTLPHRSCMAHDLPFGTLAGVVVGGRGLDR